MVANWARHTSDTTRKPISIHSTFSRFAGPLDETALFPEAFEFAEPGLEVSFSPGEALAEPGFSDWELLLELPGLLGVLLRCAVTGALFAGWGFILQNLIR